MIMKRVVNSLLVIVAAMVTFAGCAKQEVDAPATPETKTVQFFANSIETKTVFGTPDGTTYPTLWTTGDRVKVHVNLSVPSGVKKTEASVDVKLVGGEGQASSAMFTAELNDEFDADSYTIYSVNPSTAWNARSGNEGRFTVVINDSQTPLTSSVDPAAQVLYAISDSYTDGIPESVNFEYKHFTAYGKLSFKGLADGVVISKVKLESEDMALAGKWNYYVADGTVAPKEGVKSITLETSSTTDIWFACAPVDVSNKTLTLTVTTDKGDFVKKLNFPANRKFEAGKISKFTVDMTGITAGGTVEPEQPGETTEVWTLVTDASTLAVGDEIVIVAPEANHAMGADKGNNRNAAGVSKSGNTVEINDDVQIITLQAGNKSNTFAFYTGSGYLYAASSSSNYLKTKSALDDNGSWSISIASDGLATITANGSYTRNTMRFNPNNGSPLFSCYASTQTLGTLVSIYKHVGANEEGGETPDPEPTTPVISVTSETTIEVPAAGGNINIEWSVAPSVEGVYLEATEDVDWISPITRSAVTGNMQYTVAENIGDARTATITLSYTGAESKTVTVKQAAKVEVDDSFEPGQYWIIQSEANLAMKPLTGNYGFPGANLAQIVEGSFKSFAANIFTIDYIAEDECYTIKDCNGKYLYMTLDKDNNWYKSFNVSADYVSDPKYQWAISANDEGKHIITNLASQSKIAYSAQYLTWGAYADISTYALPTLIKVTEPLAVALASINVTGQATSFTEGEEFKFGGTVTANYNDGSTKDVTDNASVTTPDMVDGAEVTVSYTEGDITKTVSYNITVKAADQGGGDVQEYTYNWTATSGALGSTANSTTTKTLNEVDWTIQRSGNGGYTGWSNNVIQIGSKNNPENLTLRTAGISGTVKSVSVACASYQAKHNISISVGDVNYVSKATPSWANNSVGTVVCEGNSTGDIEIKFTKGSGARALYIKSITIVYEN